MKANTGTDYQSCKQFVGILSNFVLYVPFLIEFTVISATAYNL